MENVKVFNGTPHVINVVQGCTFNPSLRKYVGGEVVLSIPSNGMLNTKIDTLEGECINGIPTFYKSFSGVDSLPEGFDVYIVSALYASAAAKSGADMSRIFTIADPVYSADGNSFLGCRGICPAF